jgi:hypothetical protein
MYDKLLTLEEVIEGVTPIVEANPNFVYPEQGDEKSECRCVEKDSTEEGDWAEFYHDPSDCPWHFNDDNTCLYVKDGTNTQPACVVGHYFYGVLGFTDLHLWETKAPQRVLDGHGYEVEPRAQRFLNTIQSAQDQGYAWGEAYDQALVDAGGPQ